MERREMERVDFMKEFLWETTGGFVLDDFVTERLQKIQGEFGKELERAVEKIAGQKAEGTVTISYLRSSIVTGSHEFYIAYYKGEPFVEEEPEAMYLDMHRLFEGAESDCAEIFRILGKKFIRLYASEKEEIRRWYIHLLYERLGTLTESLWEEKTETGEIPVLYGGYMEEQHQIGGVNYENKVLPDNGR